MLVDRPRLLGYLKFFFFIRGGYMGSYGVRRYVMATRAPATKFFAFVIFSFDA